MKYDRQRLTRMFEAPAEREIAEFLNELRGQAPYDGVDAADLRELAASKTPAVAILAAVALCTIDDANFEEFAELIDKGLRSDDQVVKNAASGLYLGRGLETLAKVSAASKELIPTGWTPSSEPGDLYYQLYGDVFDVMPKILAARDSARVERIASNFRRILSGIRSFLTIADRDRIEQCRRAKALSWRAFVLPFIPGDDEAPPFDFSSAWDGEANRDLLRRMPEVFGSARAPSRCWKERLTTILAMTTAWELEFFRPGDHGSSPRLWIVEAPASLAVPWTKPEDLTLAKHSTGKPDDTFHVGFSDGSVEHWLVTDWRRLREYF